MKRREFSSLAMGLGVAGLGLASPVARAQGAAVPVEGKNYVRLSQPQPTLAPPGKIEVVEFFWYGCPHCFHFDPTLQAWVAKLPADVTFRRVHVGFQGIHKIHQRLFYALEIMGREAELHGKIFNAIHVQRNMLDKPETIADFVAANGIDRTKFLEVFNSFGAQTRCQQASRLVEGYKIDGVPTMGVAGRYFTEGSLAGTNEAALQIVDFLLDRIRKGH
ncbi:MAG TPA: thiol:disulfide interchange protein DsbA/DsbL [Methylibium sp.]